MAKKKIEKKETITEDVPDGTIPDGTISGVSGGEFTLEELEKIKVYKLFTGKTKPAFCFEDTTEITETRLQNLYGGGSYTLEYHFNNGTKRVEHWEIADKPADQSNGNKPRSIEDVQIAMLKEQSQMNRDLLMAVLGRGNTQSTMSEIAQMWAIMQGGNPGAGGGNMVEKMLTFLEKGIEIGATKGGDGEMDWKKMLVTTVREIAPTITNVVAKAQGLPVGDPNNGAGVTMLPEDMLRKGLATMKKQILGGMPVGLALDWIVANAQDAQYQPLLQIALSKSFDDLVRIDAELANEPYNTWFRQFLEGLREHFKENANPEDNEQEQ